VGGLIGVRLPDRTADAQPLHIVFAYRPAWLYLGTAITLVSIGVAVIYGFGLEKRVKRFSSQTRLSRGRRRDPASP
jgi:hypothetical protein